MWLDNIILPAILIMSVAYIVLRALRGIKKTDPCGGCKSCETCNLAETCDELKKRKEDKIPFVFHKSD